MNDTPLHRPLSTAQSPDLDWSQVRETVLMLELAATQINAAMKDSDASVDTLLAAFTSMAERLHRIDNAVASLPHDEATASARQTITEDAGRVTESIHQAIVAFQFYDKLVQRLDHVCHSLSQMGGLVNDRSRLFNPDEWVKLQLAIRAKYTTDEERLMFEAVLNGIPVDQAVEQFIAERQSHGNDIELF